MNPLWMLLPIAIGKALGYPIGFVLGGVALIFGVIHFGEVATLMLTMRVFALQTSWELIAVPLFILMGCVLERAGIADKLYGGLHVWMGSLRGGLAVATVITCTIMAAAMAVMGAPVVIMGIIALPQMLKRGYNVELAAGTIMAGGSLGIFIPPSIMLIIIGAWAGLSVGRLFLAAIVPGLVLSGLYICYILIRCGLQPALGPVLPEEERRIPFRQKLLLLLTGIMPTLSIIFVVIGSLIFGVATPTEAGAMGTIGSLIVAVLNRRLTWSLVKGSVYQTARIMGMVAVIAIGSTAFIGIFMGMGGGRIIEDFILGLGVGPWGFLAVLMGLIFLLGMIVDWLAILMIAIPVFMPIADTMGFDPIWIAILICMNLQMSFLTPPFAIGIFYLRGVAPPAVNTGHLLRSVIPFVLLILIGVALVIVFPSLALWLPDLVS
ncbi:MAG: C4-dicarboxylate TRAP transporter large permease protein DctM [Dehalococcoidia bacterium]|nr:C4-dicarboxylate TRAP transporter large permease protein DctM [Chloroflexota bacterium]MBT9161569.1 C4-dicarboxylate TRAP transporter large permease protein DctM [Chloroflexota bacterium]